MRWIKNKNFQYGTFCWGTVTFHTDATEYRCSLDAGKSTMHKKPFGRRIFVYLANGLLSANDMELESKDQARIDIEEPLTFHAEEDTEFILIDVPSCKGWGYSADTLRGQKK